MDPEDPGHVGAPTAGLVSSIAVQVNHPVERGAKLLTLEAMKMQSNIYAPITGRVTKLLVTPGPTRGSERPAGDDRSVSGPTPDQTPSNFLRGFCAISAILIIYLAAGLPRAAAHGNFRFCILHDGQNLFDGATSFIPGMDWHVGQTADHFISEGRVEPLIIVGIYNAGKQRLQEYTPTRMPRLGGGRATATRKFLTGRSAAVRRIQLSCSGWKWKIPALAALRLVDLFPYFSDCACRKFSEKLRRCRPRCGGTNA